MDDDQTVTENALVSHPGWASTSRFVREWRAPSSVPGYYQPITMISLMLDTAMGGRPDDFTAFHRTNLVLHLANVLLAGLIAYAVFGSAPTAVFTALLFGLHPLVVEPLAWLSERKTLLATLFAWLAVWLYLVNAAHRVRRTVLPLVAYAVALLCKPSVVPLPLLLIVLDFWPLRRAGRSALLEKWPFFVVAVVSSAVTSISQKSAPITPLADLGPGRLLLEALDLVGYYGRLPFFPVHLTPLIPTPNPLTFATPDVLLGSIGTLVVLVLLWRLRRVWPAGLTGAALWFAALAPAFTILSWSSFIAYGRYLYFPVLGLMVAGGGAFALAWSSPRTARARPLVAILALLVFAAEARASREALNPWRSSVDLWRHVAALAPNEPEAHNGYGLALERQGDRDGAAAEYRRSIAIVPSYFFGQMNLGTLERERGNYDESIRVLTRLASYAPGSHDAFDALATSELAAGRWADAEKHLRRADVLQPDRTETLDALGLAMLQQGETDSAMQVLRRTADLHPEDARSRFLLAAALLRGGVTREALDLLAESMRLAPDWPRPRIALAWSLATAPDPALRDPAHARSLAEEAVTRTSRKDADALDALGASRAALGDFAPAVEAGAAAAALARASHADSLARAIDARVTLYRRGRAFVASR